MRLNCGDTCPKTGSYNVVDAQGNVINTIYVGEGETDASHTAFRLLLRVERLNKGITNEEKAEPIAPLFFGLYFFWT